EEGIVIYCGDCREILPQLPNVDLVLTDPPYGVGLGVASKVNNNRKRFAYSQIDDSPDYILGVLDEVWDLLRTKSQRLVITPGTRLLWDYPKPDDIGVFYYPAAVTCTPWGFLCWQPILYYGPSPRAGKGSWPNSYISTEAAEKNGHPVPKPIG